jgi:hypothetical protein
MYITNQSQWSKKCYHGIDQVQQAHKKNTREEQEKKFFGRAYSTGRQMINKLIINQGDYKNISIIKTNNHFISTFLTLSFLFSSLTLFCSSHTKSNTSHELL